MPSNTKRQKIDKRYSRQFPIREYLYRRVAKAGIEPELLPSERKLASEFGVARDTIRAVLAELQAGEYCMSIPGRRGWFTNPAHSNPDISFVGVLAHRCRGAELSHYAQGVLSRLHLPLEPLSPFYQFISLPDHFTAEERADHVIKQRHEALLWLLPEGGDADTLACLWDRGAPLTVVATDRHFRGLPEESLPDGLLMPSEEPQHLEIATRCKQDADQTPLFVVSRDAQAEALGRAFEAVGLRAPETWQVHFSGTPEDKLQARLAAHPFSSIFICPGDVSNLGSVLDGVRRHDATSTAPIILPYGSKQMTMRRKYGPNVHVLGHKAWSESIDDLAMRTTEKVKVYLELAKT